MLTHPIIQQDMASLIDLPVWKKLSGKTMLITGATGMLGAYIAYAVLAANKAAEHNIRLILMGRNKEKASRLFAGLDVKWLFQDICDPLNIDEHIDYIIHTAGPVGPSIFNTAPLDVISANVIGTMKLLEGGRQCGCEAFVLASTHEVYGRAEGEQNEEGFGGAVDPMSPRSCYILAKQTAENVVACHARGPDLRPISARLSRLYGPLMNLDSGLFICDFIKDLKQGRSIHVKGNSNLIRPLCYISDAAKAMLFLLAYGEAGKAYNVQAEELSTIGEIADQLSILQGGRVIFAQQNNAHINLGHWLNTNRLKALNWTQSVSLSEGLRRTLEYFLEAGLPV